MTTSNLIHDVRTPVDDWDKIIRRINNITGIAVEQKGRHIPIRHEQEEWHLLWAYDEIEDRYYKWKWWLTTKRDV